MEGEVGMRTRWEGHAGVTGEATLRWEARAAALGGLLTAAAVSS